MLIRAIYTLTFCEKSDYTFSFKQNHTSSDNLPDYCWEYISICWPLRISFADDYKATSSGFCFKILERHLLGWKMSVDFELISHFWLSHLIILPCETHFKVLQNVCEIRQLAVKIGAAWDLIFIDYRTIVTQALQPVREYEIIILMESSN